MSSIDCRPDIALFVLDEARSANLNHAAFISGTFSQRRRKSSTNPFAFGVEAQESSCLESLEPDSLPIRSASSSAVFGERSAAIDTRRSKSIERSSFKESPSRRSQRRPTGRWERPWHDRGTGSPFHRTSRKRTDRHDTPPHE